MRSIRVLGASAALVATMLVGQAFAAPAVNLAAPDFSVKDSLGQTRKLSEFRGRYVVLEWTNHECPFVRKHYDSGNMQNLQKAASAQNMVWLSIISSAPGKQGHVTGKQADELTKQRGAKPTAVLLDENGRVGKLYGAQTTPHMFIVAPTGELIYAGAIDDKPSTDVADIPKAKNYVKTALEEVLAGNRITTQATKPYGCPIKY